MCQDVFHQSKDAPSRDLNLSFHTRCLEISQLTAFELVTILEEYKDVLNMAQQDTVDAASCAAVPTPSRNNAGVKSL